MSLFTQVKETPLYAAARLGYIDVVQLLLKSCGDPNYYADYLVSTIVFLCVYAHICTCAYITLSEIYFYNIVKFQKIIVFI